MMLNIDVAATTFIQQTDFLTHILNVMNRTQGGESKGGRNNDKNNRAANDRDGSRKTPVPKTFDAKKMQEFNKEFKGLRLVEARNGGKKYRFFKFSNKTALTHKFEIEFD